MKKIFFLLTLFVLIFIGIRSINYVYHVNWSGDQASFAIEALRVFRTKDLTLIGPQISANYQGRFVFQGPAITYMMMFFLFIGKWDPIISSYLFMLFCSLMIFPLYFGVKKLINEKSAWLIVIIYTLTPYYINYSRFLWNSTFLFSLLPILLLLMGLFKEKKSGVIFFSLSVWLGILLQFHYQFILVIFSLFIYYFVFKKIKKFNLLFFLFGISLGFSPLIIFELKHRFYNLQTILLFAQNWNQVDKPGGLTMPHYYISISFMLIVLLCGIFAKKVKKVSSKYLLILTLVIGIYALILNITQPVHAFWAPTTPWNYLDEKKIYDIIKTTNIKKAFNVANLAYYDTPAIVIKYFMKRDHYRINYEDYYHNDYLFVISEGNNYLGNPAYEVGTFKPHKIINKWKINERFDMLLLKRE